MEQNSNSGFHVLKGEKAIEALEECIRQLEEGKKSRELTPKQARTMIKLANILITVIDDETTILKSITQSSLWPKLKDAVGNFIPQTLRGATEIMLPPTVNSPDPLDSSKDSNYCPPPPTQQIR